MATTIIDLDAILGDDKHVKLASKTYVLPPDLPVELYLRINRFAQKEDATEVEMFEALYEEILGLFRYKQPKLESLPLTLTQLVGAVAAIYGQAAEEEDNAARPPVRRGTNGPTTRRTTKSRR